MTVEALPVAPAKPGIAGNCTDRPARRVGMTAEPWPTYTPSGSSTPWPYRVTLAIFHIRFERLLPFTLAFTGRSGGHPTGPRSPSQQTADG